MYDDEEDVKVYLIYFKKRIYAWSTNKNDKNMFLEQRNKSLFTVKKVIMDSLKYRVFYAKNKDKELVYDSKKEKNDVYIENLIENQTYSYSIIPYYEINGEVFYVLR